MGKKQIVTFGEIMLRLAPYDYERIIQANSFQINYGGGEANVAVSLANFSNEVFFVSRLPDNPLGNAALNAMRKFGVNTSYILRGGSRIGIYFLEYGASIRSSKVIYDRAHSAISEIKAGMVNWNEIFSGKDWFHVTGITPAISKSAAEATIEAVMIAKNQGLTVSCDLNYRKKLWNREDAKKTMTEVVKYVDIVIGNEEDASDVFGIESASTDVKSGNLSLDHYKTVASKLMDYCHCKKTAITMRESYSASDNNWSALLFTGKEWLTSRKYSIHIVDRVGGGDAFCAGIIHGLVNGWTDVNTLEFAVAASALKQTIHGDMNMVTEDEVMEIVKGDLSGRVQR